MKHTHHKQPRHLGGTNDKWNLEDIDFIEHAKIHADRFLAGLDSWFDFRHTGWKHLDDDLRTQVLEKASQIMRETPSFTQEGRIKGGITRGRQSAKQKTGVCGRTPEQMTEDGKKGGKKGGTTQGLRNAKNRTGFCNPDVQRKNARKLNSLLVKCTQTGHISTPGGLSRYQQSRGIDHTDPNNREIIK